MKTSLIIAAFACVVTFFCNLAIAEVIPFELKKIDFGGGYLHFDCTYAGVTEKCMFDSGSDSSFIKMDSRTAQLPKIRDAKFTGASGMIKVCDVVSLDSFSIGLFTQKMEAVRCSDKATIVGIDAFSKGSLECTPKTGELAA